MKILVSTFGSDDCEKVIQAMRLLPYERLVLIEEADVGESKAFERIRKLEEISGHEVCHEAVDGKGFMDLVAEVSEILHRHAKESGRSEGNSMILNISGGSKLLGDAALFSAFRLGIETYHCDERLTRLPVIRGATAKDRFTTAQQRLLACLGDGWTQLDDVVRVVSPGNRQPVERVLRELRKGGLLVTEVRSGKIRIALSREGAEVAHALKASKSP